MLRVNSRLELRVGVLPGRLLRVNSRLELRVGVLPGRLLGAQALIKRREEVVQDFICGAAHAVRAGYVGIAGDHCTGDTHQRPIDPHKIVDRSCSCRGGAVALIVGSDGLFHIGPKLVEIADFCPELHTIQRHTGRYRLHGKIGISVAVHDHGVCFILAGNVPLNGVRVLDRGQTDKICQFGVKFVQYLNNPIQIEIMEIGVGCSVNRIVSHNCVSP